MNRNTGLRAGFQQVCALKQKKEEEEEAAALAEATCGPSAAGDGRHGPPPHRPLILSGMSGRGLCTRLHVLGCRLTYSAWTEQHVRSGQTHFLGDGDGFPRTIKASPARGENPGGVTPRLLHPLLASRKSSPEAGREALQTLGVVRASHPNKPGPAHLHLRPWPWAAQHTVRER